MLKCWTSSGYDPKKAQVAMECMIGYCAGYKTINVSCGGSQCCTSSKRGYTFSYRLSYPYLSGEQEQSYVLGL